jgi:hypothetical protein
MKKDSGDKLVKEKIASVDTLSGGIVFGKEEAWEKLQARMDKKPAKVVSLRFWLAAAAVLLLFGGLLTIYLNPAKQEVGMATNAKEKTPVKSIISARPEVPEVVVQPQPVTVHTSRPGNSRHAPNRKTHIVTSEETLQPAAIVVNSLQMTPAENPKEEIAANNTAPVTPVVKTMKVVYINDVENGSVQQNSEASVASPSSIVLSKLPVVHINDVEREAVEVKKILRENRMSFGHFPFYRSTEIYEEDNSNTEEYHQPINFLKRKTNTPN